MAIKRPYVPRNKSRFGNPVARVQVANYGPEWWSLVKRVRERDTVNGVLRCTLCGDGILTGERAETHHLRPITRSGSTTMRNLGTVCVKCHKKRHPHMNK